MTYRTRTLTRASVGLILMAGLGLYAYYGLHKVKEEQGKQIREESRVWHFRPDTIRRLVIETGGIATILERRDGGEHGNGWQMVEPVSDAADDMVVDSLLKLLGQLRCKRRLAGRQPGGLAGFGLEPPRGRLALTDVKGRILALRVGSRSSFSSLLYLQQEGQPEVLVVEGRLEDSLLRDSFDLRRKELLRFGREQVTGVQLDRGDNSCAIERQDGDWYLLEPVKERADRMEVTGLLNSLHNLRARSFPNIAGDPGADFGVDPSEVTVTVYTGVMRKAAKVQVGKGKGTRLGKFFARRWEPAGPVAEIEKHQFEALLKTPFDFQAKTLMEFNPASVFRIKFSSDEELVVLEKRTTGSGEKRSWELVSPRAARANNARVEGFLQTLGQLKASAFLPRAKHDDLSVYGLGSPLRTLTLYDQNDREINRLMVGTARKEGVAAMGGSLDRICLVPAIQVEKLALRAADFLD